MTAPPQGVEVEHVEFPAGTVRFYRAGAAGPAVVLLHGGGLDNALLSWRHAIPVLAADHRVYLPDLPGQGGSTPWHGRANQRTFEEVLRWLLDAWNQREATLVGLSMGGSIAAGFTLRHPRRVRGLVLADSAGLQPRLNNHAVQHLSARFGFVGRFAAKTAGLHRSLLRHVLTRHVFTGSRPVTDLESIVDEVRTELAAHSSLFSDWQVDSIGRRGMLVNHLPHLDQIQCPTMILHGENDRIVPQTAARQAADAIPGSMLRIVPDAGHWPNRERPAEFNALLREFVNGQSRN